MESPETNHLYKTILSLRTLAEARLFFRDLLTESEIQEFSMRWKAAKMLSKKNSLFGNSKTNRFKFTNNCSYFSMVIIRYEWI